MKWIFGLFIIIVCFSSKGFARKFYFANAGSNSYTSAQAQNPSTPWQTLAAFTLFRNSLLPDDSFLFKRGEVFYGTIDLPSSVSVNGSTTKPIYFGAWGSGNQLPVLDGRLILTSWVNVGTNLWEATNSNLTSMPSALMVNDQLQPLGRFPNSDSSQPYLTITTHPTGSSTQFSDNELPASPDWTGAELVIRNKSYTIERIGVLSHSGNTITLSGATGYEIENGKGYFFQNHPDALDREGEWCFISGSNTIRLYSITNPNIQSITVANTNNLINFHTKSNFIIDGLQLVGSKNSAASFTRSNNLILRNCVINNCGQGAIDILPSSSPNTNILIENNEISNTEGTAIDAYGDNLTFRNNRFKNIAKWVGMSSIAQNYWGIYTLGNGITIERNRFDTVGGGVIYFLWSGNVLINENYINYYTFVLDDAGAIYCWWNGTATANMINRKVTNNIVLNGVGASGDNSPSEGIYVDDRSQNVEVTGNTIAYCKNSGIYIHNVKNVQVKNNFVYGCRRGLWIKHDNLAATYPVQNCDIQNNTFVSSDIIAGKQLLEYGTKSEMPDSNLAALGVLNNNFYIQPFSKSEIFNYFYKPTSSLPATTFISGNLSWWKGFSGYDANSISSPVYFPKYTSLLSANLISNGTFNTNINGWSTSNGTGNTATRVFTTGVLTGGSLQFSTTGTGSSNSSQLICPLSTSISFTKGEFYLLKFTIKGTVSTAINCYLLNNASPFTAASTQFEIAVNDVATECEYIIPISTSVPTPRVMFLVGPEDGVINIDNVEFYKATPSNVNDYIQFEYNETTVSKTIVVARPSITPQGISYPAGSTILLSPFQSIVLLNAASMEYQWSGATNRVWLDRNNWSKGFLPYSGANVSFPSGLANYPILGANTSVGKCNLQAGSSIGLNGFNFTIADSIMGTGSLIGSPQSSLQLQGVGTLYFSQQTNGFSNSLNSLTINTTGTITLANPLKLTNLLKLTTGTLVSSGNLTLVASNNGVARIPALGGNILGDVVSQLFVPAKVQRKYSFMGSAISQSINNAWQQQVYITGVGSGGAVCGSSFGNGGLTDRYNSNGFDKTQTNTPSMYSYNSTQVNGTRWVSIPNTHNTNLIPGIGYRLNIRGDRNLGSCLDQLGSNAPAPPTAVILSATGSITQGNVTVGLNDTNLHLYTLLANPYPCQISFSAFKAANTNINNKFWTYSPYGNGNYTTYSNGLVSNAASGYNQTNADYLAIGQAFFVEANKSGNTVTFKESNKTDSLIPNFQYFGAGNNQIIRLGLFNTANDLLDECVLRYNNYGSKQYSMDWDAVSLGGGSQSLTSVKGTHLLAIATRAFDSSADTVSLNIKSSQVGLFHLQLREITGFDAGFQYLIKDNFLGTRQAVHLTNGYSFYVTNDTASYGSNRLALIIVKSSPLSVLFGDLLAEEKNNAGVISWSINESAAVDYCNIERETKGGNYEAIGKERSLNASPNGYQFIDYHLPNTSYINYRVAAVFKTGNKAYSKSVTIRRKSDGITTSIFPNPTKDLLHIHGLGMLSITIIDATGRVVINQQNKGIESTSINVAGLAMGSYTVRIERSGMIEQRKFVKE